MKAEQLPNALCVFRILLVPPLLLAISHGRYDLALLLFLTAGFTDGLDGFLARTFDWRSELGALLDPLADKLLMVFVVIWLALAGLVPGWLAVILVVRDVVIVTGALSYRVLIGPFHGGATPVSKLNTLLQLVFVAAVLAGASFGFPGETVVSLLGSVVFVTAVVSGLDYVRGWSLRAVNAGRRA